MQFNIKLKFRLSVFFCLSCLFVALSAHAQTSRTIRWAHVYEPSHPLHTWAMWASEQIYKKTNGRYRIKVYPSSSLGKEAHINQSLSLGSIDIIYTGTSFAAQAYGALSISEMPYIFADYSHWKRYINSEVFTNMAKSYTEKSGGNIILSSSYYGVRHLTSNRPVLNPKDITGLKIRVPSAAVYQLFPLSLGAKPSPISFSEVYLAIQQGVVDAQENPLTTIQAKKFYEVQSHINLTGHILGSILAVVNKETWQNLSKTDQVIFSDVIEQAAELASQDVLQQEAKLAAWFEAQGVIVNPVDRQAFRNKVLEFYESTSFKFDRQIYEQIQKL